MAELDNDADDLTLGELLALSNDAQQEELHTATAGRVEAFYAEASPGHAAQTADITPMVTRRIPRRDGTFATERMPTLRGVPVVFTGSGGWFLRFPIAAGDEVLLVCCERDLARWRLTGEVSDPIDVRHHHLAHAVAIPGLRSRPNALPAPTGSAFELGHTSGATVRINDDGTIQLGGPAASQFVPLANLVDTIVNAFLGATPVAGDGGAALQAAVHLAWVAQSSTTASTKVKAL